MRSLVHFANAHPRIHKNILVILRSPVGLRNSHSSSDPLPTQSPNLPRSHRESLSRDQQLPPNHIGTVGGMHKHGMNMVSRTIKPQYSIRLLKTSISTDEVTLITRGWIPRSNSSGNFKGLWDLLLRTWGLH